MVRSLALVLLAAGPALAQGLQPGEWQFTNEMSSPMFRQPQRITTTHCVTPKEASDPQHWMGGPNGKSDCQVTSNQRSGDTVRWTMSCPKSGMTGKGVVRLSGGKFEGRTDLAGTMNGRSFEMHTTVTGHRVGPCKGG